MRRQNFQTIAWFYDLFNRKLLDLEPSYQRRSVWNQNYRDYFIDTILLGYPAPAIFLFEEIAADGVASYHVVDGKQRLTAIFDFAKGDYPVGNEATRTELRGRFFDELSADEKNRFWSYTFSVEYLSTTEESVLNSIFDRINRNVAKLTSQELRHAKYSGSFIKTAEDLTEFMYEQLDNSFPRIGTPSRRQMKDVELVSQILLLLEKGPLGYSTDELDGAFSDRDTDWEFQEDIEADFRSVVEVLSAVLRADADAIILRSRFRNQADFYSLFGTIDQLLKEAALPEIDVLLERLREFLTRVDDENIRSTDQTISDYYEYARTASNRTTARRERIRILKSFLLRE